MVRSRLPKVCKILIVFLLCTLITISPVLNRPAKAAMTGTTIVVGSVAVAAIAAALGITVVASNPTARANINTKFQNIYENNKTMVDGLIASGSALADNTGKVIKCSADNLMTIFRAMQAEFTQTSGLSFSSDSDLLSSLGYSGISLGVGQSLTDFKGVSLIASASFPAKLSDMASSIKFQVALGSYILAVDHTSVRLIDGTNIIAAKNDFFITNLCQSLTAKLVYFSDYCGEGPGLLVLCPNSHNGVEQAFISSFYLLFSDYSSLAIPVPGQDLFNPSTDKFIADGYSSMAYPVSDVIDKVKQKVGDSSGNIGVSVPADVIGSDTVGDLTQKDVLGKDVADTSDKDKDKTINKSKAVPISKSEDKTKAGRDLPVIPTSISKKFPFCHRRDIIEA